MHVLYYTKCILSIIDYSEHIKLVYSAITANIVQAFREHKKMHLQLKLNVSSCNSIEDIIYQSSCYAQQICRTPL